MNTWRPNRARASLVDFDPHWRGVGGARTDGPRSRELIFANLNAQQNPDPSRSIKPRSFRIHEPSSLFHSTNIPVSRSHRTSQRYTTGRGLKPSR